MLSFAIFCTKIRPKTWDTSDNNIDLESFSWQCFNNKTYHELLPSSSWQIFANIPFLVIIPKNFLADMISKQKAKNIKGKKHPKSVHPPSSPRLKIPIHLLMSTFIGDMRSRAFSFEGVITPLLDTFFLSVPEHNGIKPLRKLNHGF